MGQDVEGGFCPFEPVFRGGIGHEYCTVFAVFMGSVCVPHFEDLVFFIPEDGTVELYLQFPGHVGYEQRVVRMFYRLVHDIPNPFGAFYQKPVVQKELLLIAHLDVTPHMPGPTCIIYV